jgi:multiple sugar transport system permease protein
MTAGPSARPRRTDRWPYLLLLPAAVLELIVHVAPLSVGVAMSLLHLTPRELRDWTSAPFVGLDNYTAWLDPDGVLGTELVGSLGRTALFTALVVSGSWLLGLLAALVLDGQVRGAGWWRALFLVPFALPAFVSVLSWRGMLGRDTGLVNTLLVDDLGLLRHRPFWLVGENAFWSIVVVSVWRLWPFAYLVIAAALRAVPVEVRGAAALDGAGPWQRFRRITLPMTGRAQLLLVVVMSIWSATDVSTPYLLFDAQPPPQATLLGNVVYQHAFVDFDLGLASAVNVMITVALFVGAALAWRSVGRSLRDA